MFIGAPRRNVQMAVNLRHTRFKPCCNWPTGQAPAVTSASAKGRPNESQNRMGWRERNSRGCEEGAGVKVERHR